MKKKKQEKPKVKLHQHKSITGEIFGYPHPADAIHKKEKTQQYHDRGLTVDINN